MTPQPVVVLSNVNSIKVYENDEFLVQVYTAKRHFVGLSHPPFILPNLAAFKIARGESMPIKQAVKFIKLATNVVERSKFHLKASDKLKILAFCKRNKLTLDDFAALVVKYLFPIDSKYKTWRFVGLDESGKEVITKCVSEVRIPRLRVIVGASHYVMSDSESGSGSLDANGESGSCVEADSCVEAESRKLEPIEPIELIGDNSYEAELIRIQVTDQFGNVLSYFSEPIILETSGEIEVIGESIIPLKGGLGGTFVKTTKESGVGAKLASQTPSKTASLKVSCPAINQSVKVSFTVHKTDRA
jgi:beta-galactosidase